MKVCIHYSFKMCFYVCLFFCARNSKIVATTQTFWTVPVDMLSIPLLQRQARFDWTQLRTSVHGTSREFCTCEKLCLPTQRTLSCQLRFLSHLLWAITLVKFARRKNTWTSQLILQQGEDTASPQWIRLKMTRTSITVRLELLRECLQYER